MGCEAGRERRSRRAVNGVRGGPRERIGPGRERRSRRAVNGVRGSGETRLRPGEGIEAGRELVEGRDLVSELDGPNVSEVA